MAEAEESYSSSTVNIGELELYHDVDLEIEKDSVQLKKEGLEQFTENVSSQKETFEKQPKELAIQRLKLKRRKVKMELSKEVKTLKIKVKSTNRQLARMFATFKTFVSEMNFLKKDMNDLKAIIMASPQGELEEHDLGSFTGQKKKPRAENSVKNEALCGISGTEIQIDREVRHMKTEYAQPVLNEDQAGNAEMTTGSTGDLGNRNQSCSESMFSGSEADFGMADEYSNHTYVQGMTMKVVPDVFSRHLQAPSLSTPSETQTEKRPKLSSSSSFETWEKMHEWQVKGASQEIASGKPLTGAQDFRSRSRRGKYDRDPNAAQKGEKLHICHVCGAKFALKSTLTAHVRKHTGEKPYKCEVCNRTFKYRSGLNIHKRIHTRERPYKCEECGDDFTQSMCLRRHKCKKHTSTESATVVKSEANNEGSEAYSESSILNDSLESRQAVEKTFICEDCGASYAHSGSLSNHRKTHLVDKWYTCKICRAKFSDNESLESHYKTHEGQKTFACEVCNKIFVHRGTLNTHKRVHMDEKPFECKHCDSKFKRKSCLETHERLHGPYTGEKLFKCDVCGAEFEKKVLLQKHRKVHKPVKKYVCEFCGTSFAQAGSLQTHRRRHTGEKPFKCPICGAEFAQGNTLHRHIRTHTGEKPYSCEICGFRCAVRSNLLLHKKRRHAERPHV